MIKRSLGVNFLQLMAIKKEEAEMKNTATTPKDSTPSVLYMAMELSNKRWVLGFGKGDVKFRQKSVDAGDLLGVMEEIEKAKGKFGLPSESKVVSCYEAGRDGFWIHRKLLEMGVDNKVVDSSSIEVNRRYRRSKTDRLDVKKLLSMLVRYAQGEADVWSVVRPPSVEMEDARRLHRERGRLIKERTGHSARIQSILITHGIRLKPRDKNFLSELDRLHQNGALPSGAQRDVRREYERWELVCRQLAELESEQKERLAKQNTVETEQIRRLMNLKGVGVQSAWLLVMEFFGWRTFRNRKELASLAGLVNAPFNSGAGGHDQGISKSGNHRVRVVMTELAWLWLRYQPASKHSKWFWARFGGGSSRMRRVGIVALARKLLVDLWRYADKGIIPEGARMKSIHC
jgi:transposase